MGYLMDTNIVSELRKEARCNPGVSRWFDAASEDDLFLSVLTLVTRNTRDVARTGVALLNPFE